jgi:hypothetical protein
MPPGMEKSVEGGAQRMEEDTMRLKELLKLVKTIVHEAEAASKKKADNLWLVDRAREVLMVSGRIAVSV